MLFTNYVLAIAWSVVMFGINTTSDITQILYIRCAYTGHFYRGKLLFYHGKLYLEVWPTFSEVTFPY